MGKKAQQNAQRPRGGFGGYHARRGVSEDAELTHVGAGTPGGEYLRRFWQPVALSSELGELPLNVRMLGEDLVLFRTRQGELGLLERHCSHRGASLEYGLPSDQGIVCCYHGWHYATDGAHHRDAQRPDQQGRRPALSRGLPDPRVSRHRLCLHGTARGCAGFPDPRHLRRAGQRDGSVLALHALQLAASDRELPGSDPQCFSTHPRERGTVLTQLGTNADP